MSAREKPAPLVWKPRSDGVLGPEAKMQVTIDVSGYHARVWFVGGEFPWRSIVRETGVANVGRVVSHFGENSAKAGAEKRLRKVTS